MNKSNPNEAKKHQTLTKIVLGIGVILLVFGYTVLTTDDEPKKQVKVISAIKHTNLVDEESLVKTKWMGEVSDEVKTSNEKVNKLQKEIEQLRTQLQKALKQKQEEKVKNKNSFNTHHKEITALYRR